MRIFLGCILAFLCSLSQASDRLLQGYILRDNQSIVSPDGKYSLIMQSDGSLVMYRSIDGSVRYRMKKYGAYAIMQTDGNFVEYNSNNAAIWATNTGGKCGSCWLQINNDGDLLVGYFSPTGNFGMVVWSIGPDYDYPALDAVRYPLVNDAPPTTPPVPTPNRPPIP
ncbi:hypothetical protein [Pseudoduganella sp. HUAS MS19]